ncbi:MAG: AmmeMemoRadiSam system radical SAM enzyme [Acidobacteriota bacterium]
MSEVDRSPAPDDSPAMTRARWWRVEPDGRILCYLCPRYCRIREGQAGFCYIRKNVAGALYSLAYGRPCAIQVDPIEKKPLYHFIPGARILSLGTAGCNMGCKFCQNWEISKSSEDQVSSTSLPPGAVPPVAAARGCRAVAFTYNEPTIWGEYVIDIARGAHRSGLKTVMVTNGYITAEALPEVYEEIDAANVDLKAFTNDFYRKITLTQIGPVLETIANLVSRGVWVEITTLIIPTLNDAMDEIRELATWILDHVGPDQPLHLTGFHPDFKLMNLPATSHETVHEARNVARSAGLRYVYEGNVHCAEGSATYCPRCGETLIERSWHRILRDRIAGGRCPCGEPIPGFFPS